ncbi:MAG: hypothetical protein ACREQC_13750, partial [Candidatus Binataceae bacterium]
MVAATPARAQLNKAYDNDFSQLKDPTSDLESAANASADSRGYSALSSLAQKFSDLLSSLASDLDGIGSVVQESDNRSALSSMKGSAADAARTAADKARALKDAADAQSDPSSQISDLRTALTDVSDHFRAVWKTHEAYRTKLDQYFTDAVRKFQNSTRDEASYQTLKSTWNDLKTASDTMNQKLAAAEISTSALSDATAAVAAWSIK